MENLLADHIELWRKTKEALKVSLTSNAFSTWFEPISSIALNEKELILEVPNQFFFEWVESHYKTTIESTIHSQIKKKIGIKYTIATKNNIDREIKSEENYFSQKKRLISNNNPKLNNKYTFTNFIEGSCNQFAKAAAISVSESPGQKGFNPLVIYGGVGLGKTHLLHAIGNHILNTKKDLRIISASSEKFTIDFISSIQKNKTVEFSKAYRKADILLIDDIQFFQGKEQTQEQFFHTFNELYQSGKQIVLTADRYPGEMEGLQDRLLSRFESGLAVDIQAPDFETRVAIIMEKAEQNGLELPYDMVEFMALHIKNNIRELESTIIRILAHSSLSNKEIDMDLVKQVIREKLGKRIPPELSIEDVVRKVSEITKIPERDIVGPSRKKQIAEARQMANYICRELLGYTLVNIGFFFGGRDHTTILHACKNIEKRIKTDDRIKSIINSIKQELNYSFT